MAKLNVFKLCSGLLLSIPRRILGSNLGGIQRNSLRLNRTTLHILLRGHKFEGCHIGLPNNTFFDLIKRILGNNVSLELISRFVSNPLILSSCYRSQSVSLVKLVAFQRLFIVFLILCVLFGMLNYFLEIYKKSGSLLGRGRIHSKIFIGNLRTIFIFSIRW